MSKWEDTVMSGDQMVEVLHNAARPCPMEFQDEPRIRAIAKAQAEISFKAGYKQAREEMNLQSTSLADLCLEHRKAGQESVREEWNDAMDLGLKEAYKAGIREVVDYFFYDAGIVRLMGCRTMNEAKAHLPNWHAKLKEWGVSEPEIDEAQELADLRHNASDDTIG